jgi:hypothetical protein
LFFKAIFLIFTLYFTENDETLCKWRWLAVKQTGAKPCARSGISAVAVTGTNYNFSL